MTPEKWQSTKSQIQNTFSNTEFYKEELSEPERGEREILEFTGPLGKMRLVYSTKPLVIDKQVAGARRIGAHHEVKYVFSETEMTHTLGAFRWNDETGDWQEIDLKGSFNL